MLCECQATQQANLQANGFEDHWAVLLAQITSLWNQLFTEFFIHFNNLRNLT